MNFPTNSVDPKNDPPRSYQLLSEEQAKSSLLSLDLVFIMGFGENDPFPLVRQLFNQHLSQVRYVTPNDAGKVVGFPDGSLGVVLKGGSVITYNTSYGASRDALLRAANIFSRQGMSDAQIIGKLTRIVPNAYALVFKPVAQKLVPRYN